MSSPKMTSRSPLGFGRRNSSSGSPAGTGQTPSLRPGWPIVVFDDDLRKEQAEDPVRFGTEFLAEWVSSQEALLPRDAVEDIFGPHHGEILEEPARGTMRIEYRLHLDPAKFHDNFAGVLVHVDHDDDGDAHVVVDRIMVWSPRDFPGNEIDFEVVLSDVIDLIDRFRPRNVTIDQFEREYFMEGLGKYLARVGLTNKVKVMRRNVSGGQKLNQASVFRQLVTQRRLHAPPHRLARDECLFVQLRGTTVAAPTSGPVQSDDIFDSLLAAAFDAIGGDPQIHRSLSALGAHAVGRYQDLDPEDPRAKLSAVGRGYRFHGTMRQHRRPPPR